MTSNGLSSVNIRDVWDAEVVAIKEKRLSLDNSQQERDIVVRSNQEDNNVGRHRLATGHATAIKLLKLLESMQQELIIESVGSAYSENEKIEDE
nr:hypothetical protein [Tanacetum cinerariifolium]